ncbi:MAG: hypothetical protein JXJ20_11100 [Anaerolineae bacterium]|nr:hypothetical protein [Anaerolineae bacterium]
MLPIAIITALVLLLFIVLVSRAALKYIGEHPEALTTNFPAAYQRCHVTFAQVVERYQQIKSQVTSSNVITWQAPNQRRYTIDYYGVEERDPAASPDLYHLPWTRIGGVGIRMQPGFKLVDFNRDGSTDGQYTTGYSFHLLIVPVSGSTIDIPIPTDGRQDAVDFVAHTVALAEHQGKRVNALGFEKPPAPHKRKIPRF